MTHQFNIHLGISFLPWRRPLVAFAISLETTKPRHWSHEQSIPSAENLRAGITKQGGALTLGSGSLTLRPVAM